MAGFNFRITDIQAAIGLAQIPKITTRIEKVKHIYSMYLDGLDGISGMEPIPVSLRTGEVPIYNEYLCNDRERLIQELGKSCIGVRPFVPNLSLAEYFKGESFNFGPLQSEDKTVGMVIEDLYKVFSNKDDLKFNHEKSNMHEAGLLRLNCDKAQSLLNWKATLSYEQTIDFVGVWYKEFYSGNKNIREITEDQINSYERIAKCNNLVWTI